MKIKKTALITGASSGIGREFAHIHAEKGGDLIIIARREDKLNELKEEIEKKYNVKVHVLAKDLGISGAGKEIYQEVKALGITVDYLINNAGFGGLGNFHERDIQQELSMIQLNVAALTEMTHYFLKDMVERNEGKILNVSSTASLMPGPLQAVYYATKAYVTSFSNALTEELRNTNVTVTNLMPGATDTEFGKVSGMENTPLFKEAMSPRNVAEKGYRAMEKRKMNIIAGVKPMLRIMMAFVPLTPKRITLAFTRKLQEKN